MNETESPITIPLELAKKDSQPEEPENSTKNSTKKRSKEFKKLTTSAYFNTC